MTVTPHLRAPLTMSGSGFTQVEQGSVEEIDQCTTAVLRTPTETRVDMPAFGRPDTTFTQLGEGVSAQIYVEAVEEWEPRAVVLGLAYVEGAVERIQIEENV